MKRILASVAVAALSVSFAFAAVEDPMSSRYGNTVIAKGADGKEVGRTYYNADNTYSRKTPDGKETKSMEITFTLFAANQNTTGYWRNAATEIACRCDAGYSTRSIENESRSARS